jgi:hypothetical protein
MEKVKTIVNSPLFRVAVCAVIGIALITEQHPLYAGLAFGVGIREFLLAFKTL